MFEQTVNTALRWNIDGELYNEQDLGFLKALEKHFCLASLSVCSLFGGFKLHALKGRSKPLFAIPNQSNQSLLVRKLQDSAVKPSGLFVIPGQAANDKSKPGLRLAYHSKKAGRVISLPLAEGLARVSNPSHAKLPVILSEDLRKTTSYPCIPIHFVDLNQLQDWSDRQKQKLAGLIQGKLCAND